MRYELMDHALPISRLVPPPVRARRVAVGVFATFLVATVFLAWAPWQQNVSGTGRVVAYAPGERQQTVDAPIDGRVARWRVAEGQRVLAGQPLVELIDNDPRLVERMQTERGSVVNQLDRYEDRIKNMEDQQNALERSRARTLESNLAYVRQAEQKVKAAQQKVEAAAAAHQTAKVNLDRVRALVARGLVAQRDVELAELGEVKAGTDRGLADAELLAAQLHLEAQRAATEKEQAEADAKVESIRGSLASAQVDLENSRVRLTRQDVELARQDARMVLAPKDGTILRVLVFEGGRQVKRGEPLATFVPDQAEGAVELWIDGNDAALMEPGRKVRLQFEGWPAVQFVGWPSVAVGTFGGVISFVDAADDGRGNFRVLVVRDPNEPDWPSSRYLRQGVRTKGWVLLGQVSLGFEVWRRFNGFPPALQNEPDATKKESKGSSS